jgi:transglutaminase-like putative cysteine protease
MEFAGWFEAFLGGRYTFDPRNNRPRIGRVLIPLGRDAPDVPMRHTFGPNTLFQFQGVDRRGQLVLSALSGRTIVSSGFYALQSGGLGEPQPKNLLGLLDAAQLKMSERLEAPVTASRSLSKLR